MNMENAAIVSAALTAVTPEAASDLQAMIAMSFGNEFSRPLGDRVNNYGTLASAADYDLKLVETVTNMQDAVVERAALEKYGDRATASKNLQNPRSAAVELFFGKKDSEMAELAQVTFYESDPPTSKTLKFTAVFRDKGTGISNSQVPRTIFGLGGSYKEDAMYLQGAFGLGGELTYRNADFVVLVTRKAAGLLAAGEPDLITVAVVEWKRLTKVESAYYLVGSEWNDPGDVALPWSCPASDYPEFEAGTHLALVSYKTTGLHRQREGDARSFDTIINTRLVSPIFPVKWRNYLSRGELRATVLRGLHSRLDNTEHDFPRENETMPFIYEGKTYLLDIGYTLFNDQEEKGKRGSFVAHNHAVLFTSNGQVQNHWTPADFKAKTKLKKLDQRILIEVNLDSLPISARTSLFTADRAETVKSEFALRLESQVLEFINDWDSLKDENRLAIEKQMKATSAISTRGVSDKIRRAFSARGFGGSSEHLAAGVGRGGSGGGPTNSGGSRGGKRKVVQTFSDPTAIGGPATAQLVIGTTKFLSFWVDATDEFFDSGRGRLSLSSSGAVPFNLSETVALGQVRNGYFRVSIGVPEGLEPGSFVMTLSLTNWTKSTGGLGPDITHDCEVSLVSEIPGTGEGAGAKPTGKPGTTAPGSGSSVVLVWASLSSRDDWSEGTVGALEELEAQTIALSNTEFADLAPMGDTLIPCLILNQSYGPLVSYLSARAATIGQVTIDEMKARYAVGVGVDMLVLKDECDKLQKNGEARVTDAFIESAYRAAARGTLAVLPEFDQLSKLAELDA